MIQPRASDKPARMDAPASIVPFAVRTIVLLIFLMLPLKIVRYGYLPVIDDPVADAAKAVSGRPWTDILVLKPYFALDPHIGWHALLRTIHLTTNSSPRALVVFSVIALFVALSWSAVPWFKRPEAWLATFVLVIGVITGFVERLMIGRPFLVSAAVLVTVLCLWQKFGERPPSRRMYAALTGLIALAVVLHGSWYLWALPVAAFYVADQRSWGRAFGISWIAGALLGAVLTGHPIGYLLESVRMGLEAFGHHAFARTLVSEFQPTRDSLGGFLLLGGLLVFRKLGGHATRPLRSNPAFWLACFGLVLGYQAMRFWSDWGLVALMVVIAFELEAFMIDRMQEFAPRRLWWSAGLAAALYLMSTNDVDSRWTTSRDTLYLAQDNPELAGWLPERDGILYAADMSLFYQTFYRNPDAPWKYMVGFEPAMMPDEDFRTYQNIMYNHGNSLAYKPWLAKMRPADRIALRLSGQPQLAGLEWKSVNGVWLGRLPTPREQPTP
jgi:MFS family permease